MSFKDEKRPIGGCWFTAGVQRTEAGKGEGRRNGDPFPERTSIGYVRFPRHSDYAGDCMAGGDENQIGKVCQTTEPFDSYPKPAGANPMSLRQVF